VFGTPHHRGGVACNYLANDQPVKEHAHRCQVLLHAWRGVRLPQLLDIGSDMHRLERAQAPASRSRHRPTRSLTSPPDPLTSSCRVHNISHQIRVIGSADA
jgi:hypothetical protein